MVYRNHVLTCRIISLYKDFVFLSILYRAGNFASESAIPTLMGTYQLIIYIHFCICAYSFKTQEDTFTFESLVEYLVLFIISYSLIKRSSFFLHVFCIPCMRKSYILPFSIPQGSYLLWLARERTFLELPTGIKRKHISCCTLSSHYAKQPPNC